MSDVQLQETEGKAAQMWRTVFRFPSEALFTCFGVLHFCCNHPGSSFGDWKLQPCFENSSEQYTSTGLNDKQWDRLNYIPRPSRKRIP